MWDLIVCGAGNAGLCAAISAKQHGASVLVLEKAPSRFRGGNSSLTKNFRFTTKKLEDLIALLDAPNADDLHRLNARYRIYSEGDFAADLMRCSSNKSKQELVSELAFGCRDTINWLSALGHSWEVKPWTISSDSSLPIRLKGGGRALQQKNFEIAESLGIDIRYETAALCVDLTDRCYRLTVVNGQKSKYIEDVRSIVFATGGFQANAELVEKHIGSEWHGIKNRGVPYNTGDGLQICLSLGGQIAGAGAGCHSSPQSSNMPDFIFPGEEEISQANSRYCYHFGITVNRSGRRFFDEGSDLSSFTYAEIGRKIQVQEEGVAFQIFDSSVVRSLPKGYFSDGRMLRSHSLKPLARSLGISEDGLEAEIAAFNQAIRSGDTGIRAHYRREIKDAPFFATPVRAGLTFTYPGVSINRRAEVLDLNTHPIEGLYACGEIVGGLFHGGYPGGAGLMAGAHFGRVAGIEAAAYAKGCEADLRRSAI